MKFEEIQEEWEKDRPKEGENLATASIRASYLHGKYWKILRSEARLYNELALNYKALVHLKTEYYLGHLSQQELQEHGWQQCQLRIVKSDIPRYLDGDVDLQKAKLQLDNQKSKTEYLADLIKHINASNYQIKNAIDYLKFTNGQN